MALPFIENFTGVAAVLPNPPWTQAGLSAVTLNRDGSGHAKASASDNVFDIMAYDNSNTYSNDQYGQVTIITGLTANVDFAEVMVRCSGTDSSFDCLQFITDGTVNHTELWKYLDGDATLLQNFSTTFAANDVMKISVVGSIIECFKNGVSLGTKTDSSITSGAPGCGVFNSTSNNVQLDSFEGGNIGATAVLTGTAMNTISETDIVTGGNTIIITLSGDTWIPQF